MARPCVRASGTRVRCPAVDPIQISIIAFGLLAVAFLLIVTGNRSGNQLYIGAGGAVGAVSQLLLLAAWRAVSPSGANLIVPAIGTLFFGYLSVRAFWRWRSSRSTG